MAMLTQALSLERGSCSNGAERRLRDPSFSLYLNGNEDFYSINLSKKSFGTGDKEIDVFSAEKYFNEEKPEVTELPHMQDSVSGAKTEAPSGASSVRSVFTWNSQSALLHRVLTNPSVNGASRAKARSYLGSLRCRCVCTDKNSVAVEEYQSCGEVLHLTQNAAKEPAKRVVSPITEMQCMANQGLKKETYLSSKDLLIEGQAMKPRMSMEIFGAPLLQSGNKPFSFEMKRKLTLNWDDGLARPAEIVIPTVTSGKYDESDSDSSSDLFEIEDFINKENPFLSTNMSDSTMPTAYAPSEGSIEWSVVTASAADFPITLDFNEFRPNKNTTISKTASKEMNQKVTAPNDKPRRLYNSFLACTSRNSINVVNHAQTANEKNAETKIRKSHGLPTQVHSSQTEDKLARFETARNMQIGISSRSQGQSKPLHGSNALHFQ